MADNLPVEKKGGSGVALHSRQRALKKVIAYHLRGLGDNKGLLYKSLEKLNELIGSSEPEIALAAIDKILKLLPYVVQREGGDAGALPGQPGAPVNIQINNFGDFLKDRLKNTHLGQVFKQAEDAKFEEIKKPASEGATPGGHRAPTPG